MIENYWIKKDSLDKFARTSVNNLTWLFWTGFDMIIVLKKLTTAPTLPTTQHTFFRLIVLTPSVYERAIFENPKTPSVYDI